MLSSIEEYMQLCRLCLVKDKVNVPLFGDASDVRQILARIRTCLPVKVSQDDNLPKRICDECLHKVDMLYQFRNTSINAEKQLVQWLSALGVDVKLKGGEPALQPETILLKEEQLDPEPDTKENLYPSGFGDPLNSRQADLGSLSGFRGDAHGLTTVLPPSAGVKRPRGRPPKQKPQQVVGASIPGPNIAPITIGTANRRVGRAQRGDRRSRRAATNANSALAAAAAANSSEGSEDEGDDRLDGGFEDSEEDEKIPMGRVAKVEVDSEDEQHIDNSSSLEPTTFVGVPSSVSAADQPGPSALNPTVEPSTEPGDESLYEDHKLTLKDPIEMEPIVTIVELPATTDWKTTRRRAIKVEYDDDFELFSSDSSPLLNPRSTSRNKKSTKSGSIGSKPRRRGRKSSSKYEAPLTSPTSNVEGSSKCEGYTNPFVYDHLKIKEEKPPALDKLSPKTKWTCLICNKNLSGKTDLIDHYQAHKENKIAIGHGENLAENEVYQCEVCLKDFTSEKRFEKHMETHSDSRFTCEFCQKSFKRPYEFAVHMRFHSNDNKLKCHICDYSTSYNSALKTHIKRHESEYKYRCELCGKGFFVYTWFEEHKNFHTGAKPFECDLCGKQFAYTRYLTAHRRSMHPETYGGGAPIINECQFCHKRFAHKKSLLLHVRGHTGENTVLCDICGKRLSSNDHLKLHRRIHTGYKPHACSVCGKSFSKKCNLTLHERVHSGEKPYVCETCGKCFSQRSTLVIHNRYHTGARPYVCHLCNKGFVAKGVLSIHLKSCNRQTIMGNYLEIIRQD